MNNLGGRPRILTDEKQEELLNHIGQGATVEQAAHSVGVSLRTVQREAKENRDFGDDLQHALGLAPTDLYPLMLTAARAHWRAAAWLLERTDPERFGKRPPNSCRPEQMMDLASTLIEAALEFVAPAERESLGSRLQAAADETLEAILPPQRKIVLATFRPTTQAPRKSATPSGREQATASCQEAGRDAGEPNLEAKEILSPKMHFATKPAATEPDVTAAPPVAQAADDVLSSEVHDASQPAIEPDAPRTLPKHARAVDRKALNNFERDQARLARRKEARAKRKGRNAA
jgi:hypothetical protein